MINENNFSKYQKFCLPLKSRTSKKRIIEAEKEITGLYPFKVERSNIFVTKTDKKGFYNVYITDRHIQQSKNKIFIAVVIFIILLVTIPGIIFTRIRILKNNAVVIAQKEREKQEQEDFRILKEKEENLKQLIINYDQIQGDQYEKMYPYIERIYSVLYGKTTVENLIIQRDSFSVEVTTNDAMKILENFENSGAFSSIKMNRSTVNNKIETVNYNGDFSRYWKHASVENSIDEQIIFYIEEIEAINERLESMKNVSLSEYITEIRTVLHKNGCNEQYIQLRENNNSAEVEFFILSSSRNILNFINEIQSGENNLIDIKQLHIRNSEDQSKIQTTICFDSKIELDHYSEDLKEYEQKTISASEIDRIFYKAPVKQNTLQKNKSETSVQKTPEVTKPVIIKKLTYVGITKSGGITLIIAKDEDMEKFYKLALCSEETEGDYCVETEYGYKARIKNDYYEVKK